MTSSNDRIIRPIICKNKPEERKITLFVEGNGKTWYIAKEKAKTGRTKCTI